MKEYEANKDGRKNGKSVGEKIKIDLEEVREEI